MTAEFGQFLGGVAECELTAKATRGGGSNTRGSAATAPSSATRAGTGLEIGGRTLLDHIQTGAAFSVQGYLCETTARSVLGSPCQLISGC